MNTFDVGDLNIIVSIDWNINAGGMMRIKILGMNRLFYATIYVSSSVNVNLFHQCFIFSCAALL